MRVAFLTNTTATVSYPVFERLVAASDIELVHTYFYDTLAESRGSPLQIIAKYGVRKIASKVFGLVLGKLRSGIGGSQSPLEHVKTFDLPYTVVNNINDACHIESIAELSLDAVVVCVCKNILKPTLLSTPGVRFINIHPSLLPKYRGPTPTFWALYHGESQTGITFHAMTADIDRGRILAQTSAPIDHTKSEEEIELELFSTAAGMIEDVLWERSKFDDSAANGKGSYFTYPTPSERRELNRRLAAR